jgi:hypothetical protein
MLQRLSNQKELPVALGSSAQLQLRRRRRTPQAMAPKAKAKLLLLLFQQWQALVTLGNILRESLRQRNPRS